MACDRLHTRKRQRDLVTNVDPCHGVDAGAAQTDVVDGGVEPSITAFHACEKVDVVAREFTQIGFDSPANDIWDAAAQRVRTRLNRGRYRGNILRRRMRAVNQIRDRLYTSSEIIDGSAGIIRAYGEGLGREPLLLDG